jgi:hypothetical protein
MIFKEENIVALTSPKGFSVWRNSLLAGSAMRAFESLGKIPKRPTKPITWWLFLLFPAKNGYQALSQVTD